MNQSIINHVAGRGRMAAARPIKRLVICVDGTWTHPDGTTGSGNNTNVYRIKAVVKSGMVQESGGREVQQIAEYFYGIGTGKKGFQRLESAIIGEGCEQQIKDIVKRCCEELDGPEDELFLFGFSRGAYVVRAVAGFLHHMNLPTKAALKDFDQVYKQGLELYRARREKDEGRCGRIYEHLSHLTQPCPIIKFVGVFDTVKFTNDKALHDIGFVKSIRNLRHALALNENRSVMKPEIIEPGLPEPTSGQRSFVQAWFLGAHGDMGGATSHDGLSLYPLQWMLIESSKCGLELDFKPRRELRGIIDDPLKLVFPTTWPLRNTMSNNDIWQINFRNGLNVEMHDLRPTHQQTQPQGGRHPGSRSHTVRLNLQNTFVNSPRKPFIGDSLRGWQHNGPYGTIIHPSVNLELDLRPRIYEHSRLRADRNKILRFLQENLAENQAVPWILDSTLSESGISAFRILVCGKSGVGKSTLINRVFGVPKTHESTDLSAGVHDIDEAFSSDKNPGLLIHDSRGYQSGSNKELQLIKRFLQKRAAKKNPAEQLHVIWYCIDSDASRIEAADIQLFQIIAKYSMDVPVFIVGTKKDKTESNHFTSMYDDRVATTDPSQLAQVMEECKAEAKEKARGQYQELQEKLEAVEHYRSDGICFLSRNDEASLKELVSKTLALIDDARVRLFAVAAQVVDLDQKIESAITECLRLGRHASQTAMVPLPFSGMVGTPTVARILCEQILQCFGFPNIRPQKVIDTMRGIVWGNLSKFMAQSLLYFVGVSGVATGLTVATGLGGIAFGIVGCLLSSPPTARMVVRCACDTILILEKSFFSKGKYVTETQVEDAANWYVTKTVAVERKQKTLQDVVHSEVDELIPLSKIDVGLRFNRLRTGMAGILEKHSCRKDPVSGTPRTSMTLQRSSESSDSLTILPKSLLDLEVNDF